MKLGLLSAILSECTFEQVIDYAAEIGYQSVEVACWPNEKASRRYAGTCHIDVEHLSYQRADEILKYCEKKKIEISALAYYPNPLTPDLDAREKSVMHICRLIDAANILGISTVNTFIGKDREKTVSENLKLFRRIWPDIIEYAEKKKVRIGIENCPMYFSQDEWPGGNNLASTPEIWEELFESIPSRYFGLNYDPSHLFLQRIDYIKPLYKKKKKIFHVHFKDIRIDQDKLNRVGIFSPPLSYMEPKVPGLGQIDWAAFVSALYQIGYQGAACVEIEDKAFENTTEDIILAVKLGYRYMHQFVG